MSAVLESGLDPERKRECDANDLIDRLIELGFDQSARRDDGGIKVACSKCEVLAINGVPCHEHGCINTMRECSGCTNLIPALRFRRFCEECT